MDNFGVGIVLRSENKDFKPGDFVDGYLSTRFYPYITRQALTSLVEFQEYSIWPPADFHNLDYLQVVNRPKEIPASVYTGALGLAGKSAFSAYHVFAEEKTKEVRETLYES